MAILFGFSPKFGALVSATPGGVLGGITVVLYGMIGLLGAKIWKENRVDFGNPINLVPIAAGIIIAIGNTSLVFTDDFQLSGIALGTHRHVGGLPRGAGDRSAAPQGAAAPRSGAPIAVRDRSAERRPTDREAGDRRTVRMPDASTAVRSVIAA